MILTSYRSVALRCAAALLLAGVAAPSAARAQDSIPSTGVFKTAEQIFSSCTSTDDEELASCDWFLMAAHDMMKFYGDTGTGGDKICLPMGSKAIEIRNTVVNYWRTRPEARKYSAVSTIYNALSERYGC